MTDVAPTSTPPVSHHTHSGGPGWVSAANRRPPGSSSTSGSVIRSSVPDAAPPLFSTTWPGSPTVTSTASSSFSPVMPPGPSTGIWSGLNTTVMYSPAVATPNAQPNWLGSTVPRYRQEVTTPLASTPGVVDRPARSEVQ